jgi:streptogramin lyase
MFGIRFARGLFTKASRGGGRRRPPARYRPALEGLEDRRLLATFHEYPLPDLPRYGGVSIEGITAGPDGNVWFTDTNGAAIGRITPSGSVTEFVQTDNTDFPRGITTGADGNLWVAVRGGGDGLVKRITPDGTSTNFPVPTFIDGTFGLAFTLSVTLGPDGNIWYSEEGYSIISSIGNVTPDGQATGFPNQVGRGLVFGDGMTAGPDGNVWFTADTSNSFNYAGRITPNGQYTLFRTPNDEQYIYSITAGPDGNLWAGAFQQDRYHQQAGAFAAIDRISVDGQFTVFPLPQRPASSNDFFAPSVTVGPDGNIWFTEGAFNRIGRMTLNGQITEYDVPTPNSRPNLITTGPDGNIWFTEAGNGQIGQFALNDGGGAGGGGAASANSAGPTSAARSAAIDALFAGARPDSVSPVIGGQQPAGAAVDTALSVSQPEAVSMPQPQQAVADTGAVPHRHKGDGAVAADTTELADPLAEAL